MAKLDDYLEREREQERDSRLFRRLIADDAWYAEHRGQMVSIWDEEVIGFVPLPEGWRPHDCDMSRNEERVRVFGAMHKLEQAFFARIPKDRMIEVHERRKRLGIIDSVLVMEVERGHRPEVGGHVADMVMADHYGKAVEILCDELGITDWRRVRERLATIWDEAYRAGQACILDGPLGPGNPFRRAPE